MKLASSKEAFLAQVRKIAARHVMKKKLVYLLTGAPASGKSWILKNLTDTVSKIDSDVFSKSKLVETIEQSSKIPIVALTIGISTFIKNNPQFDIKLLVIQEELEVIKQRMVQRGGTVTPTLEKRIKRMKQLAAKAVFSGTTNEVLWFLRQSKK